MCKTRERTARSRMRVFKYFTGELTSVGTTTTGAGAGIWLEGPAPSCVCAGREREHAEVSRLLTRARPSASRVHIQPYRLGELGGHGSRDELRAWDR